MSERTSIVVIGGGASGVILAAQLLRSSDPSLRVTLIEKRPEFGQGLAYSTDLPVHLLNVSAFGMSALNDDPEHFLRWLRTRGLFPDEETPFYAPRSIYGEYLQALLSELAEQEPVRLRLVNAEAVGLKPTSSGIEVGLANGASIIAHTAVLAAGHDSTPAPEQDYATRIGLSDLPGDSTSTIMILGTGLSMADAWLTLEHRGHQGNVIALSRRGRMPMPHRPTKPIVLDSAEIPLGTELSFFMRWFRDLVDASKDAGGDWRDVIDGLRPFNQKIWQSWPESAKRRFLEHTKAWWDIHRHRMPPAVHQRVSAAVASGQLTLVAGRLLNVTGENGSRVVSVQRRQSGGVEKFEVSQIYDCTGIVKDVSKGSLQVIRSLIDRGFARPDPLRIGLDVTTNCAVIDANGKASDRLLAVGPLTRGTFFEIDAVPDIRTQCAWLARQLAA
ncbi:MAG TPA: FAD/NAD(P)-binding protein [Rhizobiaceae bacterium]|nr:FAD/NAD(P)-binding protein [Rhizobiaceae bacterium]